MTNEQRNKLYQVENNLQSCRAILDDVMYCSEPLDDAEFKKVRECYDKICEAIDKL